MRRFSLKETIEVPKKKNGSLIRMLKAEQLIRSFE
jgi:hypothetical protein